MADVLDMALGHRFLRGDTASLQRRNRLSSRETYLRAQESRMRFELERRKASETRLLTYEGDAA